MIFCVFCSVFSQYATISFIKTIENCLRLVYQLSTKSSSKFHIVGSSVISCHFGTRFSYFDKKFLCELYLADFSFKWFSYIAGLSILWFCSSAAVKRFELILSSSWRIIFMEKLLISISSVKCSVSSRSFLVDHSVDVSPCFLITLKEIADWLRLASPVDIYVEHNMNWGVQS